MPNFSKSPTSSGEQKQQNLKKSISPCPFNERNKKISDTIKHLGKQNCSPKLNTDKLAKERQNKAEENGGGGKALGNGKKTRVRENDEGRVAQVNGGES